MFVSSADVVAVAFKAAGRITSVHLMAHTINTDSASTWQFSAHVHVIEAVISGDPERAVHRVNAFGAQTWKLTFRGLVSASTCGVFITPSAIVIAMVVIVSLVLRRGAGIVGCDAPSMPMATRRGIGAVALVVFVHLIDDEAGDEAEHQGAEGVFL